MPILGLKDQTVLGLTLTDRITGFTGVATGYVIYITGCNQVLLAPKVKGDGSFAEPHWFDEQRLTLTPNGKAVLIDNGDTRGSDKVAPAK